MFKDIQPGKTSNERKLYMYIYRHTHEFMCHMVLNLNEF